MEITAWGETKEIMDFLNDPRVHPSLTRDVLVKRIKRGFIPEIALTKGVCDENRIGDTKARQKARNQKNKHRAQMFLMAQEIRRKYNVGVDPEELQRRYGLSKSQLEKFISGNEYYNIHWAGSNVPDEFKEIVRTLKNESSLHTNTAQPQNQ